MLETSTNIFFQSVKNLFQGRIGRVDFYLSLMLCGLSIVGLGWLFFLLLDNEIFALFLNPTGSLLAILFNVLIVGIYFLVVILLLSLIVRRFHDMNRNGWQFFLMFIPLVNILFVLYPGTKGENAYGADRSNDHFLDVLLNRPPKGAGSIVPNQSKRRQIAALIVLILHLASVIGFLQIDSNDDMPEFQKLAAQARTMSKEELEAEISLLYSRVSETYNLEDARKIDAYLFVYDERFPNSSYGTSIHAELLDKYGACFSVPEGQCKE